MFIEAVIFASEPLCSPFPGSSNRAPARFPSPFLSPILRFFDAKARFFVRLLTFSLLAFAFVWRYCKVFLLYVFAGSCRFPPPPHDIVLPARAVTASFPCPTRLFHAVCGRFYLFHMSSCFLADLLSVALFISTPFSPRFSGFVSFED